MNASTLVIFIAGLVIVCVQSQDANRCGVLGRRCRNGQYCYRPNESLQFLEFCRSYRRRGALCDDVRRRCRPELECRGRTNRRGTSRLRICQDPLGTSTTSGTTIIPNTSTMMPTSMSSLLPDMSTMVFTDMPTMSTDVPTMTTNVPTMTSNVVTSI
ncbi:hypothetical protein NPIL_239541 [Nephila pilipes]|uniref:Uncharacterized protein n=1 Tax=Nephila pilipes TaxID=299642 RepID=A0A8X6PPN0_NEPPI|nr:hypothetical protein NPIL_239541 [Nephila pilipes]